MSGEKPGGKMENEKDMSSDEPTLEQLEAAADLLEALAEALDASGQGLYTQLTALTAAAALAVVAAEDAVKAKGGPPLNGDVLLEAFTPQALAAAARFRAGVRGNAVSASTTIH